MDQWGRGENRCWSARKGEEEIRLYSSGNSQRKARPRKNFLFLIWPLKFLFVMSRWTVNSTRKQTVNSRWEIMFNSYVSCSDKVTAHTSTCYNGRCSLGSESRGWFPSLPELHSWSRFPDVISLLLWAELRPNHFHHIGL